MFAATHTSPFQDIGGTRMFFPCCVYQPKGNLGLPKIAVLTGALAIGLVGGASAQTTGLRLNPTI
jgi:hypothetical protein